MNLAVENDRSRGARVLEQGDDQVEAAVVRGGILVQGNPDGLNLGNLFRDKIMIRSFLSNPIIILLILTPQR